LPGADMSNVGVFNGACPRLTPGILAAWQKKVVLGNRVKVNRNFVGCNRLVFCGVLVSAVILVFI